MKKPYPVNNGSLREVYEVHVITQQTYAGGHLNSSYCCRQHYLAKILDKRKYPDILRNVSMIRALSLSV